MLVQVYVDDIIFGATKQSMVNEFEQLMQQEFQMSSMGELTFFLGFKLNSQEVESSSTKISMLLTFLKGLTSQLVGQPPHLLILLNH